MQALRFAVASAALVLFGLSACAPKTPTAAPAVSPAKATSVAAYCAANGTVDAPPEKAVPTDEAGAPVELATMGANKWRCVGGAVLVCADSADGDQCSRKDDSRTPPELAEGCRDTPDVAMLPTAATHFSRFDWGCRGGKAVIAKEYPLDARGFLEKAWAKAEVTGGKVTGPASAPEIVR